MLASWTTSTVYVRAVVSDPFGSYDIDASNNATTQPKITITDPLGSVKVNNVAMPRAAADGNNPTASTRTFEYAFMPTAPAASGFWTASVTAPEGTEGTISDTGVGTFKVMPSLSVLKLVATFSDPVNNTSNPKAIPGAVMLYTITVTNSSYGSVDSNSTVLTDPIPVNTSMCVSTLCSNPPLGFTCSASPACGLTFTSGTSDKYSNNGGASYAYTPAPDAGGYDANVTNLKITPAGTLNGAPSTQSTSFSLLYKVKIK